MLSFPVSPESKMLCALSLVLNSELVAAEASEDFGHPWLLKDWIIGHFCIVQRQIRRGGTLYYHVVSMLLCILPHHVLAVLMRLFMKLMLGHSGRRHAVLVRFMHSIFGLTMGRDRERPCHDYWISFLSKWITLQISLENQTSMLWGDLVNLCTSLNRICSLLASLIAIPKTELSARPCTTHGDLGCISLSISNRAKRVSFGTVSSCGVSELLTMWCEACHGSEGVKLCIDNISNWIIIIMLDRVRT